MRVRIEVQFTDDSSENEQSLASVAYAHTSKRDSVEVSPIPERENSLAVEFTMRTEAKSNAVDKLYQSIQMSLWKRMDLSICFPKTEAELARDRRKNERQKERRRERKRLQ